MANSVRFFSVLSALFIAGPVTADVINITIDEGAQTSPTVASCTGFDLLFANNDCTYNQSSAFGGAWVGYQTRDAFFAAGEGQVFTDTGIPANPVGVPISGTLQLDTTGECSAHTIAGTVEMGAFTRNFVVSGARATDNFPNGITQTIAETTFSSGEANAEGGCDYTLGAAGVPALLTGPDGDFPGSVQASAWNAPGAFEIAAYANATTAPNVGASATATIGEGYTCINSSGNCVSGAVPGVSGGFTFAWNTPAKASWNNIVGSISTDGAGDIIDAFLYLVHDDIEISTFGGMRVTAFAYTLGFTGSCGEGCGPPEARDDAATVIEGQSVEIAVLANDTGLGSPASVTISTPPLNGTAVVSGSPGQPQEILITYTPSAGFVGVDTFAYTVDTPRGDDSASVTVTVLGVGANDDQAFGSPDQVIDIDVLANDIGFEDPVRLELVLAPDAGGSAEVVNSAGVPVADGIGNQQNLRIRYTPNIAPGTALPLEERFTYQVTGPIAAEFIAQVYELTNITQEVVFGVIDSDFSANLSVLGGTATIDNGNVSVSGIAWELLNVNASADYSGDWETVLGDSVTVTKINESCEQVEGTSGSACDGPRGLLGDWIPGQLQDGSPSDIPDVTVTLDGDTLRIVRLTEFVECPGGPPVACGIPGILEGDNLSRTVFTFMLSGEVLQPAKNQLILTGDGPSSLAIDGDFDGPISVSLFSIPVFGTAQVSGSPGLATDISISYTPGSNFPGTDAFQYLIDADGELQIVTVNVVVQRSDTAEVTVTLVERVVNDLAITTDPGEVVDLDVLGDAAGLADPVTVAVLSGPSSGTAEVLQSPGPAAGIRIRYTPNPGFRGVDELVFTATDFIGTETATARIGVGLTADDTAAGGSGQPIEIDVLANDVGFTDPVTVTIGTAPANGSVEVLGSPGPAADIRVLYTAAAGFPAGDLLRQDDSFSYLVSDGVFSGEATVDVEVFVDADGDGIPDDIDNCLGVFNPDQRDTSGSGFGNRCDADFNGDGIVNFADLAIFRARFATNDPDADLNGDGVVNFEDLAIFISLFGKPPGPSALVP